MEIDRDSARLKVDACWIDALALFKTDAQGAGEAAETGEVMRVSADRLLEELDGLTPSFDHFLAAERARARAASSSRFLGSAFVTME